MPAYSPIHPVNMKKLLYLLFLVPVLFCAVPEIRACSVPVFYYALSRWQSDLHSFTYGRGTDPQTVKAVRDLLAKMPVNADVGSDSKTANRGSFRICYPHSNDVWWDAPLPGPDTKQGLNLLTDSPVRQALVRAIVSGQSMVWLLLESGDKTADDAAVAQLEKRLRYLEKNTELPAQDGADTAGLDMTTTKLRIAFSVLRIKRQDAGEAGLLAQLLHLEKNLAKIKSPMAFAVFGRGRILSPIYGKDFSDGNIDQICLFAVGSCSCEVKSMNPGVDLLLNADWDTLLQAAGKEEAAVPPPKEGKTIPKPEVEVIKPRKP